MTQATPPSISPANVGQFATKINYQATATYFGGGNSGIATSLLTEDATPPNFTSAPSTTAFGLVSQIRLQFNIVSDVDTIMAAGNYTDTLKVTLEPQ